MNVVPNIDTTKLRENLRKQGLTDEEIGAIPLAHAPETSSYHAPRPDEDPPEFSNLNPVTKRLAHHILEAAEVFADSPNDVFELTLLEKGKARDYTRKGYYSDWSALAAEAARQTQRANVKAVYVNLQEIDPECINRAENKMMDGVKAVSGADVTRYRRFLIDIDREGIKDISATDEEKAALRQTLDAIREFLVHDLNWPDPRTIADSGNGYHESWLLDLPATKEVQDLIVTCYRALNQKFGTDTMTIDDSLADPNQLIKLPGTKARKGDNTKKRPHRFSKLLDSYETEPVTLEQLRALAALYKEPAQDKAKQRGGARTYWKAATPEAVEEWAKSHDLVLGKREDDKHPETGTGYKWRVDCLTCDGAHTDGAVLILNGSGNLKYRCHHNRCSKKTEADVLAKYSPPGPQRKSKPAAPTVTLADVVALITAIAGDTTSTDEAKMRRLADEVAGPVGQLDQVYHFNVELALVEHLKLSQTKAAKFTATCRMMAKQAAKQEKIEARIDRQVAQPANGKTQVVVNNRQLDEINVDALAALVERNHKTPTEPLIYVRGGALTRVVRDETGNPNAQPLNNSAILRTLAETADWVEYSIDDDGNEFFKPKFPPDDVVRSVGAMGEWPGLPALEGVVNAPTFAPDGTLHSTQGYNPVTRLYNASTVKLGDTTPTPANVEQAKGLIVDELLGDFPFKDDASRAHAVGLVLLPFARPMIDGPTPLHLVDSPMPGTGKGLLISACALPATGRDVHSMAPGKDEDEWRKRLTSTLLLGGTHLSIDNIREPLDSGVLASALTQEYIEDRILGLSQMARLRVRTIWCANGNNITPSDEIARRSIWIRLDANAEKPWERDGFKHTNLRAWVMQNRSCLVTATVTLVRAWVDKGMPAWSGKNKGSYDAWSATIGGILETVEIPGFLGNEAELFDTTVSDTEVLREFVKAWWDKYKDKDVMSKDLFKLASYPDDTPSEPLAAAQQATEWHGLLDSVLGSGKQRSRQTKMGALLSASKDRVLEGYKIEKRPPSRGNPQWRLLKCGEPSDIGSPHQQASRTPVDDDYTKESGEPGEPEPTRDATREEKFFTVKKDEEQDREKFIHSMGVLAGEGSPRFTTTPVEPLPKVHHEVHHNGKNSQIVTETTNTESEIVTWTF